MVDRLQIVAATVLALSLWGSLVAARRDRAEVEDVKMGEEGLLAALAVQSSPKGKSLCNENSAACMGPDRGEMALALIAARTSRPSLIALASLVRFKLDGAYAEEYESYVLDKGAAIHSILASLRPEKLHTQCSQEFADLARSYKSALEGVHEDTVCAEASSIRESVRELMGAIQGGKGSER